MLSYDSRTLLRIARELSAILSTVAESVDVPMWGRVLASRARGVSVDVGGVPYRPDLALSLSSGRLARLAPGSVVLNAGGGATLLATCSHGDGPLVVDFRARAAARGVIPSTFPRRETALAPTEILTARLVDRSLRPAINRHRLSSPNALGSIDMLLLSADRPLTVSIDALAVNAASAASAVATIQQFDDDPPAFEPVGASRIALLDGKIVAFPSLQDIFEADISLTVAARDSNIIALGIDSVRTPYPESDLQGILESAVEVAGAMAKCQVDLVNAVRELREVEGRSFYPREYPDAKNIGAPESGATEGEEAAPKLPAHMRDKIFQVAYSLYEKDFVRCRANPGKAHRAAVLTNTQRTLLASFPDVAVNSVLEVGNEASRSAFSKVLRRDNVRIDGRRHDEIRAIRCETDVLPGAVHGSSLFERGDTQVLACATVGLKDDAQRIADHIDTMDGLSGAKSFFLHYSFPGFATGESGRSVLTNESRRETGHGHLAESALRPLLGKSGGHALPFVARLSAQVLASDGSSSMASVCAGSLALMDAGVEIQEPVAGVAMGLVGGEKFPHSDPEDCIILTDILGAEDHYGYMDCKISGTSGGITSAQLDLKSDAGLLLNVVGRVFERSRPARLAILELMNGCISEQRSQLPDNAPRSLHIPLEESVAFKELLRDRAAGLKQIESAAGVRIQLDSQGGCARIHAPNAKAAELASQMVQQAVRDVPVGTKLRARVIETNPGYAVLETENGFLRGTLHVSKMNLRDESQNLGGLRDFASTAQKSMNEGSDGMTGGAPRSSRFSDVRHVLKQGDTLDVAVVESCKARNILRFSMISRPPFRPLEGMGDAFLGNLHKRFTKRKIARSERNSEAELSAAGERC